MNQAQRAKATLALSAAMISWAMAPVFIRVMRGAYDPYSQAFIRYFFGAAPLVILCLTVYRDEFIAVLRRPKAVFGVGCLCTLHQTVWTVGCYSAPATLAQLITQLGVVFVIILSFLLFREERGVVRSPVYLGGTALSFAGLAAVVLGGNRAGGSMGVVAAALLLATAMCWGCYVVWSKHIVTDCHPVPMYAAFSIVTTINTGLIACFFGHPSCIIAAGAGTTAIAFVSGLLPLATAHPAFHYAQKHLGSAFCSSCNLLTPLLTYLFAAFFLDDAPLTAIQWAGVFTLLSGTMAVVWAGRRFGTAKRSHSEAMES